MEEHLNFKTDDVLSAIDLNSADDFTRNSDAQNYKLNFSDDHVTIGLNAYSDTKVLQGKTEVTRVDFTLRQVDEDHFVPWVSNLPVVPYL